MLFNEQPDNGNNPYQIIHYVYECLNFICRRASYKLYYSNTSREDSLQRDNAAEDVFNAMLDYLKKNLSVFSEIYKRGCVLNLIIADSKKSVPKGCKDAIVFIRKPLGGIKQIIFIDGKSKGRVYRLKNSYYVDELLNNERLFTNINTKNAVVDANVKNEFIDKIVSHIGHTYKSKPEGLTCPDCAGRKNRLMKNKEGRCSIQAWLTNVANSRAIDMFRYKYGRGDSTLYYEEISLEETVESPGLMDFASDPERQAIISMIVEQVNVVINNLNPEERLILQMYYTSDRSVKEIALYLKKTEKQIYNKMAKIKKYIKNFLKKLQGKDIDNRRLKYILEYYFDRKTL